MQDIEEKMTLLQLNEACLKAIIQRLPITDQINLTSVCEYLKVFMEERFWPGRYAIVVRDSEETKLLEYGEYEAFFIYIEKHLETLIIGKPTHHAFRSFRSELAFYLSFRFPSLRRLEWDDNRFDMCDMRLVLDRWPALEFLRLPNLIAYAPRLKDLRNYMELLEEPWHLQHTARIDNILEFIEESPRLVEIYLSDLMGDCTESLLEILVPLIATLEIRSNRCLFKIKASYISSKLLKMTSYVMQNVLRFVTETRNEARPWVPYMEFQFSPYATSDTDDGDDDDEDTTETD